MKKEKHEAVPALLRRLNARRVLEALQSTGPSTRAQLTRRTRISPPTMSKLIAQLERDGLIEQEKELQATAGRPGVVFRLATERARVVGVVIDADRCTVAGAGLDGRLDPMLTRSFPTPRTFDELMARLAEHVRAVASGNEPPVRAIGLTVPGLIDRAEGKVVFSPNQHFLDGRNPGHALARRTGFDVATVQEEHALCLAARMFGQARGLTDFAVVDLSRGFGMGVFSQGHFVTGSRGYAGEIGHITVQRDGRQCGCGNRGCLETVATDHALAQACSERLGRPVDIGQVIDLVRGGTLAAGSMIEEALDHLAVGVAAVINIFNPECVLLHGRMFDLSEDLLDRLVRRVRTRALEPSFEACRIERTEANKPLGAVAGAIQKLYARLGPRLGPA